VANLFQNRATILVHTVQEILLCKLFGVRIYARINNPDKSMGFYLFLNIEISFISVSVSIIFSQLLIVSSKKTITNNVNWDPSNLC